MAEAKMKLTYFSVMAKGLGPAICCELSGLDWDGPKSSGFNADTDWAALKPTTPFGQLPLLEVDGLRIAQCVAIVNYIGKKAGTDGHGRAEFATSQMLLAEAEDIYAGLQKFCATAFVPLEKKCTPQEAAEWWDGSVNDFGAKVGLPSHLEKLEALLGDSGAFTSTGTTVGEAYLFSMLHQMVLVKEDVLDATAGLKKFHTDMAARPEVAKVLSGESAFGPWQQYFKATPAPELGSPPAAEAPVPAAKMPLRPLGSSGLEVSAIALGCFAFGGDRKTGSHLGAQMTALHNGVWGDQDDEDTFATVKAALDAGVNFFDNAEMYGDGYAEEVMGRALKASGYSRDQYYIATKVSESYLSADLLKEHLDGSLKRIGVDCIDLYQLHWASRAAVKTEKYPERPLPEEVPLEETLAALEECKAEGKIKHIGVCNFGVEDLKRALATGTKIVSNQICYNLLWRGIEDEVVPFCIENDIAILPWSPMGQGLLTGKVSSADDVQAGRQRSRLFSNKRPQQRHGEPGLEDETFAAIRKMKWVSDKLEEPMANVSLAWAREMPGITSLLMGARTQSQLERNLTSLQLSLDPTTVELLNDAGAEVKQKLGANLDPYESADSTRIV